MLLACDQARRSQRRLDWLDLMAGCGVRALRWGQEAAVMAAVAPRLWVNDGDPQRLPWLEANLAPLSTAGLTPQLSARSAEAFLAEAFLAGRRFDLIDLDAFGSPGALLQPALKALAFGGILFLASTDGRSPTGHDRPGAVRHLGASARVHPASWELALRQQLGLIARQAWMLGFGVEPLLSFSEGRTFRIALRLQKRPGRSDEAQLGLLARCEGCGAQQHQTLLKLRGWPACCCPQGQGHWAVHGPLWLGPLQDPVLLAALSALPVALARETHQLLQRLQRDVAVVPTVWSTAELAQRLRLAGPPGLFDLVEALRRRGHHADPSGVMSGQVRTDAAMPELLQVCRDLAEEGFK
ncbi:MAG: N2,N2-dimethylguanosine tRNA methyltransferase [Synechococcus sp.]